MKTIVEPKKYISDLWGKQQIRNGDTYRMMRYVLRVEYDDKVLLHNVVTGQLAELERAEDVVMKQLPMAYSPAMEQLVTGHYLVPEGFNEYNSVNQLRRILQNRSIGDFVNQYIILPTTFCNAHCFYCYECDYPRVHMTEETADMLIDYIDKHRGGKDVTINWFGGEPLVGIKRIDQISQGLKDRSIPFQSTMISNGYLFNEEIVKRSVELWRLQRIQITLDGTEDTYNRVKAYVNVTGSPFQHVLNNIDLLSRNKVHVNIRLNVDFYNKDDIRVLIEELGERYSDNQFVTVYLNMLFNNLGYEPVNHSYDDMIALMQIIADYTARLKALHIAFDNPKPLFIQHKQCMADNPHAVMIQPDGGFCRCEHESILESYGSLKAGMQIPRKLERWKETVEHSNECPRCAIYPACYQLKHCISGDLPCIEEFQKSNLLKQTERIRALYVHRMEENKDEGV